MGEFIKIKIGIFLDMHIYQGLIKLQWDYPLPSMNVFFTVTLGKIMYIHTILTGL